MLFDLHPHLRGRSLESLTHTIPLLIHQDAGPYTVTRKSADLVFYSSLLALGSDLETHFLAFSELKCKGQPRDSCRGAWDVLMTDLNALVTSEAFVDNVNGRQIHWNFLLLLGTCDTEQGVFWGLSAYSSAGDDLMCGYCNANRTDRIFTDLRESSEWKRSERRSNNEFLASNQGNHPMRYSRVWHKEFCRLDLMHNLDHRGVAAIMGGGVLADLMHREPLLGRNIQARLDVINRMKDEHYSTHRVSCRMGKLKQQHIEFGGSSQWAELHGPHIKAANTRHLMPFIEDLCIQFYGPKTATDEWSKCLCKAMCMLNRVYRVLYDGGFFLSQEASASLKDALLRFGVNFMRLRELSQARGRLYFQVTPKVHMMQHLWHQSLIINPRWVQCYAFESMVGKLTRIYAAIANGPYARTIQNRAAARYLVLLAIVLDL